MVNMITKRTASRILALTGLLACSLSATLTAGEAAEKVAQPDILLIMPDQWRGDALSILDCAGVTTPQLDQLARDGALFRRAYVTVPSCVPARYGFLTGIFPQTSGVVGFKTKPITVPTLPGMLSKAGYHSVLVGRNMHQLKASGSCGYDQRILGSTYIDDDEYGKFLKRVAPQTGGILKQIKTMGVNLNYWQANPWPLKDEWHPTEWVINQCRDVVTQGEETKPLFLTASFYAPHPPLFPPGKHYDACMEKDLPGIARGDWVDWEKLSPAGNKRGQTQRVLLEGEVLRTAQAGYYGLIDHIDEQIAPLIRDFKARSEKAGRPWVVVFTSDHGEMLGDHGYFRKCEPFEGSANVPFLITGSKAMGFAKGIRSEQAVCLEDLMPTLLAMAGSDIPGHLDGENLLPTLRGETQQIRDWLHFEHAKCYSKEQAFHALTDGQWKYIWRPQSGREHLFNLVEDPREETDLSVVDAHAGRLGKWRAQLVKRLQNRPEGFVKDGKLIAGRPYGPLNEGTPIPKVNNTNQE
jgi:arylsulfatase A-like enzyme